MSPAPNYGGRPADNPETRRTLLLAARAHAQDRANREQRGVVIYESTSELRMFVRPAVHPRPDTDGTYEEPVEVLDWINPEPRKEEPGVEVYWHASERFPLGRFTQRQTPIKD